MILHPRRPTLPASAALLAADRGAALLVASALVLAVAGCGDDTAGGGGAGGSGAGGGSSTATSTTTTSTGADGGGTTTTGGDGGAGGAGDGGASGGGDATSGVGGGAVVVGGDRPVEVFVPASYDGSPLPLVVLLHGYTATADIQESYMRVEPLAEELGFLYVRPQGTDDTTGEAFWNATDACCNFYGSGVDDSSYLRSVIDDVSATLAVDPRRVFLLGHSNGGFMSYRMACDHADAIAAIASLAGATFADTGACTPSEPVAALQIHGTADSTILYDGGDLAGAAYPGAESTATTWATYGGCDATPTELPARDLDAGIAGSESSVVAWEDGCDPGGGTELWTIDAGAHVPALAPDFTRQVVTWLLAHPKP